MEEDSELLFAYARRGDVKSLAALVGRHSVWMRALPEGPRQVLLMRIEGDLPFREIAEELGVPLGTALTWMRTATLRLREMLGGKR